jgi:hypothetical protein
MKQLISCSLLRLSYSSLLDLGISLSSSCIPRCFTRCTVSSQDCYSCVFETLNCGILNANVTLAFMLHSYSSSYEGIEVISTNSSYMTFWENAIRDCVAPACTNVLVLVCNIARSRMSRLFYLIRGFIDIQLIHVSMSSQSHLSQDPVYLIYIYVTQCISVVERNDHDKFVVMAWMDKNVVEQQFDIRQCGL